MWEDKNGNSYKNATTKEFHANICSKLSHANDFSRFFNFHWAASSGVKKYDVVKAVMRAAAKMESPQTTLQEMTLAQYEAHLNSFALENFPNAFVWRVSAALVTFLITLEDKLMFNNRLLKHALETAVATDTNTPLQSPLGLSIREAALNICGEEG